MSKKYTIADFLEIKSSFGSRFSHDGSQIAYLSNLSGTSQIYCIPTLGGESIQLTDFPDSIAGMIFSPTENLIVFAQSQGGSEKNQLYRLNPDTKEVTQLTNKKEVKYGLGSFSSDGRYLSYSSNERNGKDFDIYVMDLKTQESECVFDLGGLCGAGGFSPSGTYLTVGRHYSAENNDFYLCNLQTRTVDCVTSHEGNIAHGTLRWLPDESGFYLAMDRDREFMSLALYTMSDKNFAYVLQPEWDIEEIAMHKGGSAMAITLNEDGYSTVTIRDPYTREILPYKLPIGEISGISFSKNGKYMSYTLGDSRHSLNISVLDMATGESVRVTNSPQGVPPELLVEPTLIRFRSFDGLEVPAFIYTPIGSDPNKKLPVIINIHGGPESQYQPGLAPLTQYFVQAGYAVIAPNVRGSSGYGKTYLALDNVEKRMDSVKDIVALREYCKTIPEIDTDKIALMGGSYGGFMVLACLAFYPDLWAAGVDTVGIVNFVTFLENTAPYRRAAREAEYGSLEKDRAFLESISPIHSIHNIQAPLLVIHGANDPRVPLSEAEQVVSKLKEHGITAELLVYPDEGHGLAKLKNRLDAYPKVVEFLHRALSS